VENIVCKNSLALYRYRDFRVGIFYFVSPCMSVWSLAQTCRLLQSRKEHKSEYTSLRMITVNDDTL